MLVQSSPTSPDVSRLQGTVRHPDVYAFDERAAIVNAPVRR
jgi:hypothetical protein